MKDKHTKPGTADNDFDEAVIASDDTGMIAGERFITEAEIAEGLAGKDASGERPVRRDHHE